MECEVVGSSPPPPSPNPSPNPKPDPDSNYTRSLPLNQHILEVYTPSSSLILTLTRTLTLTLIGGLHAILLRPSAELPDLRQLRAMWGHVVLVSQSGLVSSVLEALVACCAPAPPDSWACSV